LAGIIGAAIAAYETLKDKNEEAAFESQPLH
jgi:hypothetical protein